MNVFVLCTGRCGSMTISRAFELATNFTSGHETQAGTFYSLEYPGQHIEADNRLSWMLGALGARYPEALYIWLIRRREEMAASFAERNDYPGASIKGFGAGILELGDRFHEERYETALRMWDIANANIAEFLGAEHRLHRKVWTHELAYEFPSLWEWLGCEGDLKQATWRAATRFNSGPNGYTLYPDKDTENYLLG